MRVTCRCMNTTRALRVLTRVRAKLESFRENERESMRLPTLKIGIRISCSKEIRQCLWTTALSPAALVWKKHIACEMVFYAVFLLCVDLFLSRCYFPSFKHMTVWERASIYSVAVSLNVGKSFPSEIIDLASTYKCVPFFKYDSQSSVCHYSVRFMWISSCARLIKIKNRNNNICYWNYLIHSNLFKTVSFFCIQKNCFVFFIVLKNNKNEWKNRKVFFYWKNSWLAYIFYYDS